MRFSAPGGSTHWDVGQRYRASILHVNHSRPAPQINAPRIRPRDLVCGWLHRWWCCGWGFEFRRRCGPLSRSLHRGPALCENPLAFLDRHRLDGWLVHVLRGRARHAADRAVRHTGERGRVAVPVSLGLGPNGLTPQGGPDVLHQCTDAFALLSTLVFQAVHELRRAVRVRQELPPGRVPDAGGVEGFREFRPVLRGFLPAQRSDSSSSRLGHRTHAIPRITVVLLLLDSGWGIQRRGIQRRGRARHRQGSARHCAFLVLVRTLIGCGRNSLILSLLLSATYVLGIAHRFRYDRWCLSNVGILVGLECRDCDERLTTVMVPDDEFGIVQLVQESVNITIVVRQHLSLNAQWAVLESPFAVGHAPQALEQDAGQRVELGELLVLEETGFEVASTHDQLLCESVPETPTNAHHTHAAMQRGVKS